jgi:hypothetical protein
MPDLMPGIHVILVIGMNLKTWMAGTRPAMTQNPKSGQVDQIKA